MKVLDRKHLPVSAPVGRTILIPLALDHWSAPGWLWGVGWTLVAVSWLVALCCFFAEDLVSPAELRD